MFVDSGQWKEVSGQCSVDSDQWTVISGQRSVDSERAGGREPVLDGPSFVWWNGSISMIEICAN